MKVKGVCEGVRHLGLIEVFHVGLYVYIRQGAAPLSNEWKDR